MKGSIIGLAAAAAIAVLSAAHVDRPFVGAYDGAALHQVEAASNNIRYGVRYTLLAPCGGVTQAPPGRKHLRASSPRLLPLLGSLALLARPAGPESLRIVSLLGAALSAWFLVVLTPRCLGTAGRFVAAVFFVASPAGGYFARVPAPDVILSTVLLALAWSHRRFVERPRQARALMLAAAAWLAVLGGLGSLAGCAASVIALRRRGRGHHTSPCTTRAVGRCSFLWPMGGAVLALLIPVGQNIVHLGFVPGLEGLFGTGIFSNAHRPASLSALAAGRDDVLGGTACAIAVLGGLIWVGRWIAGYGSRSISFALVLVACGGVAHLFLGEHTAHREALLLLPLAPLVAWGAAAGLVWTARALQRVHLDPLPYLLAGGVLVPLQIDQTAKLGEIVSSRAVGLHEAGRLLRRLTAPGDEVVTPMTIPSFLLELTARRRVTYGLAGPGEAWRTTRARARGVTLWLMTPIDPRRARRRYGEWTWVIERARQKETAGGYLICRVE